MSIAVVPQQAAATAPTASRRRWLRPVLIAAAVGLLLTQLPALSASLTAAAAVALTASPVWLASGLAAALASMIAFGAVRRGTLAAAGARVSLTRATTVSYAAGAVHLTAPAGTVFSTAYAFRRLRCMGVAPAAVTFSLAVSGVLSAITLAGLAVTGIAAGTASWTSIVPGLVGAVGLAAAAVWAVRHPATLVAVAQRCLPAVNRVLRRPRDAGLISLRAAVADIGYVRPSVRDILAGVVAAALNWVLDLLCLWACAHAVGIAVSPWALLGCYALAMAGAGASPLPGGVGVVDGLLLVGLTSAGASIAVGLGAVVLYRLLSNGSVIAIGWSAIAAAAARTRMRPSLAR